MLSGSWDAAGAASKRVARLPFQTVDNVIPSGADREQQNFLHSEGLFHSEGMQKNISFRTPNRAILKEYFSLESPGNHVFA